MLFACRGLVYNQDTAAYSCSLRLANLLQLKYLLHSKVIGNTFVWYLRSSKYREDCCLTATGVVLVKMLTFVRFFYN